MSNSSTKNYSTNIFAFLEDLERANNEIDVTENLFDENKVFIDNVSVPYKVAVQQSADDFRTELLSFVSSCVYIDKELDKQVIKLRLQLKSADIEKENDKNEGSLAESKSIDSKISDILGIPRTTVVSKLSRVSRKLWQMVFYTDSCPKFLVDYVRNSGIICEKSEEEKAFNLAKRKFDSAKTLSSMAKVTFSLANFKDSLLHDILKPEIRGTAKDIDIILKKSSLPDSNEYFKALLFVALYYDLVIEDNLSKINKECLSYIYYNLMDKHENRVKYDFSKLITSSSFNPIDIDASLQKELISARTVFKPKRDRRKNNNPHRKNIEE